MIARAPYSGIIGPVTAGGGGDDFDYTNMLWRIRAADLALTDFAHVDPWPDTSGNGNDFAGSTDPPTFRTGQINGHPAVFFGGYILGPDTSSMGLSEVDLYIVIKVLTETPTSAERGLWTFNTDNNFPSFYPGEIRQSAFTNSWPLITDPTPSLLSWRLYRVIAKTGSGNYEHQLDGASLATATVGSLVFPAVTKLGHSDWSFVTAGLSGYVAEFLAFSTKRDSTQYGTIRDYVNSYYGLSVV